MAEPLVRLSGVAKRYADQPVLNDISLEVGRGEFLGIVGPSGSGKSTLLNLMGGLDRRFRGRVEVCGEDLGQMDDARLSRFRNRHLGFVFQGFGLLDHLSALENVMLPACFRPDAPDGDAAERAREALEHVGLGDRGPDLPRALSGGQKQRVAIARALFSRPDVLLADEPTGNLDSRTGAEIVDLFSRLNGEGLTLVVVTHEERVSQAAARVVRLEDGRLAHA
jgi:putative ABC transport system ATP-binding protein